MVMLIVRIILILMMVLLMIIWMMMTSPARVLLCSGWDRWEARAGGAGGCGVVVSHFPSVLIPPRSPAELAAVAVGPARRSERSHITPALPFAFEKRSACQALGLRLSCPSSYKRDYKGRKEEAKESIFQLAKHKLGARRGMEKKKKRP